MDKRLECRLLTSKYFNDSLSFAGLLFDIDQLHPRAST